MQSRESSRRLGLAAHVRACESDGQVILLDLRRNNYLGIEGRRSSGLSDIVDGWPACRASDETCAPSAGLSMLAEQLLSKGLLTHETIYRPIDISLPEATSSLNFEAPVTDADIGALRLARFVRSAAVASLWIRCRSLDAIATAVARRRDRARKATGKRAALDRMRDSAAAYQRLRPFVFTAHERCLHDSLALMDFMAGEGVFPHWVIGVKTRPFGAHSWVQSGGTVLNDLHENVRQFRPILVV